MAFKITSSRPRKIQKRIAAFEDADNGEEAGLGSSSSKATEALTANAHKWMEKGAGYAEAGDPAAALRCWDQAALIQPDNSHLHEMRAQVLNDLGRTFEAVQAAQQAVALSPDWPDAYITLGRVQLNLGEPQLALASYQAAAKLQAEHPDLQDELPRVQMLAKMHRQQPTGSRAHVVSNGETAGAGHGSSATEQQAAEAAHEAAGGAETAAAGLQAGEGLEHHDRRTGAISNPEDPGMHEPSREGTPAARNVQTATAAGSVHVDEALQNTGATIQW